MGRNIETVVGGGRGRKRPFRYPWDDWFGNGPGSTFVARCGIDFACGTAVMATTIRVQAWRRGVGVSIEEKNGSLVVTIREVRRAKRGRAKAGAA